MVRFADWAVRLQAYLLSVQGHPFAWGKLDCALFAAGGVAAQTGVDLARGLRGYRTERDGLRKVRKLGYVDHIDVFARALPAKPRPGVGDIAVVQTDHGRALGIVQGRGVYVMMPNGLGLVPVDHVIEGFMV